MSLASQIAAGFTAVGLALKNYALQSTVNSQIDAITPASIGAQPEGAYAAAGDLDNVFEIATGLQDSLGQADGIAQLGSDGKLAATQAPGGTAGKAVLAATTLTQAQQAAGVYSLAAGASVAGIPSGAIIVQAKS